MATNGDSSAAPTAQDFPPSSSQPHQQSARPPPAEPPTMERHRQAVAKIASSVARFFERKEPYRIFHGSTNTTRPLQHKRHVDISALNNVLSVDVAKRRALVEPNVPMDRLVESTLRHGLVPPIVMEFPGITCGGGFAGTGGESSSFRHGYFDDTVESVEMVLADGEVVRASRNPDEKPDLFRAAAGSVGTLGITTALELRLLKAKKYVRTTYRRTHSVAEAIRAVKEEMAKPENDYVDGILFSKDHGVIVTGSMTDEKPTGEKVQTFSGAWDPWFYLHVQDRTKALPPAPAAAQTPASSSLSSPSPSSVTEYVPLAEYLFRYDRGGFWVGRAAFEYFFMVPFTRLTRWFLDDFLHTRMMYRALHASGQSQRFVVQDLALPFETAERFVDYTADKFGIWPLWLCPLKRRAGPTFHPVTMPPSKKNGAAAAEAEADPIDDEQMLNIGLWGQGPTDAAAFVALNRDLEAKLEELGGQKWLYAHTYYAEPDFWRAYGGRDWYDQLRNKYRAAALPSVYDKVKVKVATEQDGAKLGFVQRATRIWPIGGFYGIYKSIKSRDYLLHRNALWKWKGEEDTLGAKKIEAAEAERS
ncbi:hypothetical protein PpBr36_08110 [Pyricularia pennisetigena]|uniref:hypothetical protein n=1 Tax=Pyricularia pennisetigena TaxID=1578925 RepID=UPI0011520B8A|nr:hypothetical protein PpBr36_08110 [Pyricularia pennisetigena]TLS24035.1 hypothetical protein PpBr36_08110 [Pyricularia pennisetigena]